MSEKQVCTPGGHRIKPDRARPGDHTLGIKAMAECGDLCILFRQGLMLGSLRLTPYLMELKIQLPQ